MTVLMLNEIGRHEYFRQMLGICILLEIPVIIEIANDQQISIAGGKRVNKLRRFSEEISSQDPSCLLTIYVNTFLCALAL